MAYVPKSKRNVIRDPEKAKLFNNLTNNKNIDDIQALANLNNGLADEVSELQSDVSTLESDVNSLESDVVSLTNQVNSIVSLTDGDKGDITVSGNGTNWQIDNSVITDANVVNVTAPKIIQDVNHLFVTNTEKGVWNGKQDALVSGTNIKTVNGNTLLGSGDLTISASSSITVGTTPITSGVDGRVLFQSGGVVSQDSGFTWDNTNKRLGVGISTPSYPLHVQGVTIIRRTGAATPHGDTDFMVADSTAALSTAQVQILGGNNGASNLYFSDTDSYSVGGIQYLHSTNTLNVNVNGGVALNINSSRNVSIGATTAGARLDVRAQGALSTDVAFRVRNSADTANIFTVSGNGTVWANGAGYVASNTTFGEGALDSNTTGSNNTAFGFNALTNITSNSGNTSIGYNSGLLTTGTANTFIGNRSGQQNTIGNFNVSVGSGALQEITTGNNNTALGTDAGRTITGGVTPNQTSSNSVYIGQSTRASANGNTNEIVIGQNAIGLGSNTVVLGNTSIVTTQLRGTVRLSLQASAPTGVEGAIYYDSTTKKHYGHDGTTWNALY
jgi:hypothetical protein